MLIDMTGDLNCNNEWFFYIILFLIDLYFDKAWGNLSKRKGNWEKPVFSNPLTLKTSLDS